MKLSSVSAARRASSWDGDEGEDPTGGFGGRPLVMHVVVDRPVTLLLLLLFRLLVLPLLPFPLLPPPLLLLWRLWLL